MTDTPALPIPQRRRWQPLRLGLVDIFHYDEEEIWLRDGNLLLRGNNGTGKSKVLALTLPFLLDGQLTPARIEPDGDPGKRMEWNLLLGGRYPERLGYVWLEFGRRLDGDGDGDDEDEAQYCTIGCGLRAVAGRGSPERWLFITPQRVGRDLRLLDANRRTLSRDRLLEALADQGELHTNASHYRQAVDERLFQLGPQRYEALISLLIQLRQPQLSKRPDERALSAALTEALAPVDQAILNDVADAFRNLEEERKTLDGLNQARASVQDFLVHYQRYCAVAARRRADTLRRAQSGWDKTSADLRETATGLTAAAADHDREQQRQVFLDHKLEQSETHLQTLREGPDMRAAGRLEQAAREAEMRAGVAHDLSDELRQLDGDLAHQQKRMEHERSGCGKGARDLDQHAHRWREQAREAGIAAQHDRDLAPLHLPDGPEAAVDTDSAPLIAKAEAQLDQLIQRRGRAIERLTDLNQTLDQARDQERRDRERRQTAQDQADRLDQERALAAAAVDGASKALVQALRTLLEANRELRLDDPEELLAELSDWCQTLDGDNPARHHLQTRYSLQRDRLTTSLAQARQALAGAAAEADALRDERARIEAGELAFPAPAYTRAERVRDDCPGAPLWQLLDFHAGIAGAARAGLEAALEASGLLDAWVLPDGELRDPLTWDRLLGAIEPATRGLDQVLVPAIDPRDPAAAQVTAATVSRILAGIGWGQQSHPAWVAADGRWQLGPAHGAWGKPEPAYIGHAAREASRRRRLRAISEALAALDERIQTLEAELATLEQRRTRLDREWRELPDDHPLRTAHQRHGDLCRRLGEQRDEVAALSHLLAESRDAVEQHRDARDQAALDLDLPAEPPALADLAAALKRYQLDAAGFWPSLRRHWERLAGLAELQQRLAELAQRRAGRQARLRAAKVDQRRAEEVWHTLRDTVGERVDQLQRRIADTEAEISDFKRQRKDNEDKLIDAASRRSRLSERHQGLNTRLGERDQARRAAVDALTHFAATGLLGIAAPELDIEQREPPWPIDPTVRLARRMEQALHTVAHDDNAWRRQQQGLHDRFQPLQQTLSRYGHTAGVEQDGELLLVRVLFQARPCGPDQLAADLEHEVAERKALLDAKERDLLEQHLMSDVATHLQQLIGDGERLVGRINRELEERPTSTGMKLRLAWVPLDEEAGKAPVGLSEARKRLLRQTVVAWSDDDRRAVGEFLQRRIDEVRQSDDAGTLVEHLERALDYRHWHRFTVERHQGGKWRPAYGPASGGERALVVTLPLFAAASSHYSSAGPEAPRLVMLDEAFAGIDDDSRAKCLGLMAQFDLDFVLTSEREWGCYPEVPGLAIVQLVRHEDVDAVYLSRWTWDGRQRQIAEPPLPHPPPPPPLPAADEHDPQDDPGSDTHGTQQDLF